MLIIHRSRGLLYLIFSSSQADWARQLYVFCLDTVCYHSLFHPYRRAGRTSFGGALKNSRGGRGESCTFALVLSCKEKVLYLLSHVNHRGLYSWLIHVASVWKGKKRSPENEAACPNNKWFLPEYYLFFARILLVFCPNMATWKITGGLHPPPPPPFAYGFIIVEKSIF